MSRVARMSKRSALTVIIGGSVTALTMLPPAQAQNKTPGDFPELERYVAFVHETIADDTRLYWLLIDSGVGHAPYVIYCSDLVQNAADLRGKVVRTAPNSPARDFFTAATGEVVQLMGAAQLDDALRSGLIDCLGFGGDAVQTQTAASPSTSIEAGINEIKRHAAAIGADATDKTLLLREGVLDWMFYRATAGDKYVVEDLLMMYLAEGQRTGRIPLIHMAGYWAVRAYELTARGGSLRSESARLAARGECGGREEFCKGIQIELKRLGLYAGAIDGIIGRGTQGAIFRVTDTRGPGDPDDMLALPEFLGEREPATPDIMADTSVINPAPLPNETGSQVAPSVNDDLGPLRSLDDF